MLVLTMSPLSVDVRLHYNCTGHLGLPVTIKWFAADIAYVTVLQFGA